MLSCLWNGAYKRNLAANRNIYIYICRSAVKLSCTSCYYVLMYHLLHDLNVKKNKDLFFVLLCYDTTVSKMCATVLYYLTVTCKQ